MGEIFLKGKWSDYPYRENVKITERYQDLVVYCYFDAAFQEQRYAVVLEDTIMLNTREYPNNEIHSMADIYREISLQRKTASKQKKGK